MDVEGEFETFVRARSPSLLRAAWLLTGDWFAAEDLVQSALEKVWPKWSTLSHQEFAEAYVRRAVTTTFLRGRRRRWAGELPAAQLPEAVAQDEYEGADRRSAIFAVLLRLPRRQRAVLTWRYYGDLTERQTAAAMGCSVGTVKRYTARALATLRREPNIVVLLKESLT